MEHKLIIKANPQDRETAPKYYVAHVYSGSINLKRIVGHISGKPLLKICEVLNILFRFVVALARRIKDGTKASPVDFVSFGIPFSSGGADGSGIFDAFAMSRGKMILPHSGTGKKASWAIGICFPGEMHRFHPKNTVRLHPEHSGFVPKTQCVYT